MLSSGGGGGGRLKLKAREREGEKGERFRLTLRLAPLLLLPLLPHLSNGSRGRVFGFSFPSPLLFFFFPNDSPKFKLCLLNISAGRVRKPESASHRQHPGELDNSCDCPAGTRSLRFGWRRWVCPTRLANKHGNGIPPRRSAETTLGAAGRGELGLPAPEAGRGGGDAPPGVRGAALAQHLALAGQAAGSAPPSPGPEWERPPWLGLAWKSSLLD